MIILRLKRVDDRWNQEACQGEGTVMFWIAPNLEHPFSTSCQCNRNVTTRRRFSYPTFPIDS